MSILFKPRAKGTQTKTPTRKTASQPAGRGSIKYVELYGSIASLAAGLSTKIIDYTIPDGHAAELFALGVMPDYDAGLGESNLLDTEIGFDEKVTGIKFLTNHLGMNALPYEDRLSKQPMRLLDYPTRRGSLTPKFNEGQKIQIVVTAKPDKAVANTVRARARILLYEEADALSVFGVGISQLATLPGGVSQSLPFELFAEYVRLAAATAGKGQWEVLYEKKVQDFEEIRLGYIGVLPHANADEARLYDLRLKKEWPEYEPWWKVNSAYNALVFGDDDDYQPTYKLPSIIADHTFINTTMRLYVKDLSAVIPQYGMAAQVLGTYRRVR